MKLEQSLHCAEGRPALCLTSGAFSYFPFQINTYYWERHGKPLALWVRMFLCPPALRVSQAASDGMQNPVPVSLDCTSEQCAGQPAASGGFLDQSLIRPSCATQLSSKAPVVHRCFPKLLFGGALHFEILLFCFPPCHCAFKGNGLSSSLPRPPFSGLETLSSLCL